MNQEKTLKIALAQLNVTVGAIEDNIDLVIQSAVKATEQGADLLVTPELVVTGYPPEDLLLRDAFLLKVEQGVDKLIEYTKTGVDMVVGYPKSNYSVFDEKRYFVAGSEPVVVEYKDHKLGITVCEDIWHNNAVEQTVEAGASLVINLNASPFHTRKIEPSRWAGRIGFRWSFVCH